MQLLFCRQAAVTWEVRHMRWEKSLAAWRERGSSPDRDGGAHPPSRSELVDPKRSADVLLAWAFLLRGRRDQLGHFLLAGPFIRVRGDLEDDLKAKRVLLDAVEWLPVIDPQRVQSRVGREFGGRPF